MALYCPDHAGSRTVSCATIPVSCPTCIIETLQAELKSAIKMEEIGKAFHDEAIAELNLALHQKRILQDDRDAWVEAAKRQDRVAVDRSAEIDALRLALTVIASGRGGPDPEGRTSVQFYHDIWTWSQQMADEALT